MLIVIILVAIIFIGMIVYAYWNSLQHEKVFERLLQANGFTPVKNLTLISRQGFFQTKYFQTLKNRISKAYRGKIGPREVYLTYFSRGKNLSTENAIITRPDELNRYDKTIVYPKLLPKGLEKLIKYSLDAMEFVELKVDSPASKKYYFYGQKEEDIVNPGILSVLESESGLRFAILSGWIILYRRFDIENKTTKPILDEISLKTALIDISLICNALKLQSQEDKENAN